MTDHLKSRFLTVSGLIVFAALTRLLPHPPNLTALGAMGLFAGAYMDRRLLAFAVPLVAVYASDVLLNSLVYAQYTSGWARLYPGSIWTYAAFALVVLIGCGALRTVTTGRVIGASLSASVVFFAVSNFGTWLSGGIYPRSFDGLVACYVAAIPFFSNTVAGDLLFCGVLFGGFALLRRNITALQPQAV